MDEYPLHVLVLPLAVFSLLVFLFRPSELDHIPTIGYKNRILSWVSAARFIVQGRDMVQEGFDKYPSSVFRVPQHNCWFIIVSGPKLVEELRKTSDEVLSMAEAIQDGLELNRTFGPGIHNDPYHIPILRSHLTRSIVALTPDIFDEVQEAFKDALVLSGDDWITVPAFDTITDIICRISNRVFVGIPLCRNLDYRNLMVQFAMTVIRTMVLIKIFPPFLRDFARYLFSKVDKSVDRGIEHLRPLIEEHRRAMEEPDTDYENKPETVLKWLVNGAEGEEATVRALTLRLLNINFAAIHTSSMSFTHLLYHLATMPEYIQPLREEVEAVIRECGWTKTALTKMHKVDSFIRESQRINGLGAVLMPRVVLKPFTFSDGTHLPVGATVGVAATSTHYNEKVYPNPTQFDGFRFSRLREQEEQTAQVSKWRFVTTSPDYVAFGHGRHACPGRFFAAAEFMLMFAHILVNYDVKMAEGGLPATTWITSASMPDTKAKVMFRKRQ